MKKLITILFILLSLAGYSQMPDSQAQPFYGTRYFVSMDGLDTLAIWYENDTIKWSSTDSVYIDKLLLDIESFTNSDETDQIYAADSNYLKSHVRNDYDTDSTNEYNTGLNLSGTDLELTDA